jgi:hypothetical protein
MSIIVPQGADTQDDVPLFAGYEPPAADPDYSHLSPDARRTKRQADAIAIGRHPLTGGPIHELASRHRNASSPKNDPFTCGSCLFRAVRKYHDKTYPKCIAPGQQSAEQYEQHGPPRVSHGAASDVRAWWPACRDYSPGDRISDDAARYVPGDA